MRKIVGLVAIGLGMFLLALAPLARWYVAPRLEVAPIGCTDTSAICANRVNLSPSAGIATTLFDPATLTELSNVPLTGMERVIADVNASKGANNLTVYDESQVVFRPGQTVPVAADTMRIPFNRHTSQMISCCNGNVDGKPIADYSGINPLKFGFNVQQQTYQYFDRTLNQATPMLFTGVESISGVTVYKFVQTIAPTRVGTIEVPGSLVGSVAASVFAPEYYANIRTLWVEPVTGVIVKGSEQQKQTLRDVAGTDKLTLIEATLTFTPANVQASADAAGSAASQLGLIKTTIPIVGLVLGIVLLVVGLMMTLGGRRDPRPTQSGSAPAQVAGSA